MSLFRNLPFSSSSVLETVRISSKHLLFSIFIALPFSVFAVDFVTPASAGRVACGANCLYAALAVFDRQVDYTELLLQCVDSPDGSSLEALATAAHKQGLYTKTLTRLGPADLQQCPYPAILYVKENPSSDRYNHFVLFVPSMAKARGGVVFDPPRPMKALSDFDLASCWSGKAILLSHQPASMRFLTWSLLLRAFYIIVSVASLSAILVLLQRVIGAARGRRSWERLAQIAGICSVAGVTAFVGNVFLPSGLIAQRGVVRGIVLARLETFLPVVTAQEVSVSLQRGVTLVDARRVADFENGHIDGALSISVDMPVESIPSILKGVPKDGRLIIYCQSAGCPYAGTVAQEIYSLGYRNLALFKEGWAGWQTR